MQQHDEIVNRAMSTLNDVTERLDNLRFPDRIHRGEAGAQIKSNYKHNTQIPTGMKPGGPPDDPEMTVRGWRKRKCNKNDKELLPQIPLFPQEKNRWHP